MGLLASRHGFLVKIGVTAILVIAFVHLFPVVMTGTTVGLFAFAWLLGLIVARPAVRRRRVPELMALGAAALCGMALLYDPGLLAWVMFWAALSIAALLPRTDGFDDAWRWAARLLLQGLSGPAAPIVDMGRLVRVRPRGRRLDAKGLFSLLALPLIGTATFVALFANANPLLADLLARIELPSIGQVLEWLFVILMVWPILRPLSLVTRIGARIPEPGVRLPGTSLPSVLLALAMFNAVFAIQNGLDIAFLWSGAPLPPGTSMTDYVHRGAYPLIFTALLAGFLVLTMLRPGSASAANPLARRLVALWVGQNLLLVASSALRTVDYIDQYLLTVWRIAALAWMALVATGLVLIVWRIMKGRSARWLINANALAAVVVLLPCCFVDLSAIAATWNVRHARETGGRGQALDLCYLDSLGAASLLPLIEIERRPLAPVLHDQLHYLRAGQYKALVESQADWRTWTAHGAMRLAKARALLGPNPPTPMPAPASKTRSCKGLHDTVTPPPLTNATTQ
ncbi:MAG TPA: DUF4173 domain-containing protein [Sphingomonas sp.]|nr:DUF4173 domain-containing protein [Sphingomonas sp.]